MGGNGDEDTERLIGDDSASTGESATQHAAITGTSGQGPVHERCVDGPFTSPASDKVAGNSTSRLSSGMSSPSATQETLDDDIMTTMINAGSSGLGMRCVRYCPTLVRVALSPRGREEAKKILRYCVPMILFLLTTHLARFQTVLLAGRMLGAIELDAVALALSYTNVAGLSIVIGLVTACETLFAQAFGSVNKKRVGIIMQQGVCIMTLVILPLTIIFLNAERFMLWFGQNPEVARLAGVFALYNYFTLIPYMFYSLATRYIICQGMMYPTVLFGVFGNVVTFVANIVCVKYLGLGVKGVSIGYLCGMTSYPIIAWLYIWKRKLYVNTWDGLKWESIHEWKPFTHLAISGLLMICIEWWTYEIVLLLSGVLGDLAIAVSVVVYQLFVITFMIPLAGGIAVSIAVGNALGAGEPVRARCASYVGFCLNFTLAVFFCCLYWATRYYAPYIFSSCELVVKGFVSLMSILTITVFSDFLKAMYSGIFRGVGRQRHGAIMNFVSYYIVALPLGIPLAFYTGLSYKGLWLGVGIGTLVQVVIAVSLIYRFDWDEESLKAQRRVGVETPVLLERVGGAAKKGRKGASNGSAAAEEHVELVAFRRLPTAGDDNDDDVDNSSERYTIDAESRATNLSVSSNVDDDEDDASSVNSDLRVVRLDADDQELLPDSPAPASPTPRPPRYRGVPDRRTLINRFIFIAISVTLCLLGIALRVFVPLHRTSRDYAQSGCPGDVVNGTMATPPPSFNTSDAFNTSGAALDLAAMPISPAGWSLLPETQYRVCSGFS
ncbi:multidrug and toxin extrusion protein 1-like [Sycon ciliatum]|uniref:multidrug and toxin extrusion protein 1-like n=1 Tax=Sycon ciliatum TaxID=27933 RepID=UPI0031F69C1D